MGIVRATADLRAAIGLCQFAPVITSLRQFVTASASQTSCDCHIANPDY